MTAAFPFVVPVVGVSVGVPVVVVVVIVGPFVAIEVPVVVLVVFEGVGPFSVFLVVDCKILIYLLRESVCTLYPSVGSVVVPVVDPMLFLVRVVFVGFVPVVCTDCVVYQTSVGVTLCIYRILWLPVW